MQFKAFALALIAATASAAPALEERARGACPGNQTPECCEVNALGVIATTCTAVRNPRNAARFEKVCAARGLTPACCTLGLGGIGLLCTAR